MKITSVKANNRKRAFEVNTSRDEWLFPYGKTKPTPSPHDPIVRVYVDPELGNEGFTYVLKSGAEGSLHIDHVLQYNKDPGYLRDLLLFELTADALDRIESGPLSKREIIRRLGTSPAQFYRLIDTTNYRKSVDQMLRLLQVLDCEVEVVVRPKSG